MENELRDNLLACASAFTNAKGTALATLGRLAAGDWRFFGNLSKGDKTFTARKYDEVLVWFSENWPEEASWPPHLERPAVRATSDSEAA